MRLPMRLVDLLRPLGAGAAGLACLAHAPKLKREVAIKVAPERKDLR
jgi:hypothetical protein